MKKTILIISLLFLLIGCKNKHPRLELPWNKINTYIEVGDLWSFKDKNGEYICCQILDLPKTNNKIGLVEYLNVYKQYTTLALLENFDDSFTIVTHFD